MKRDYTLLIGACGWMHAGWEGGFYPDDLPTDWQLAYYANAWPLALITARERASEAGGQLGQEECDDSLCFVGAWSWQDDPQQAEAEKRALGERYLATLLAVDARMEVGQLEKVLAHWRPAGECVVDFAGEAPGKALLALLRQHDTGWCWRGQGAAEGLDYGRVAIARVGAQNRDAKRLRAIVQTCLAAKQQGDKPGLLLFEGHPPDAEEMNMAEVIAALL